MHILDLVLAYKKNSFIFLSYNYNSFILEMCGFDTCLMIVKWNQTWILIVDGLFSDMKGFVRE